MDKFGEKHKKGSRLMRRQINFFIQITIFSVSIFFLIESNVFSIELPQVDNRPSVGMGFEEHEILDKALYYKSDCSIGDYFPYLKGNCVGYMDLEVGTGKSPKLGSRITIRFSGYIMPSPTYGYEIPGHKMEVENKLVKSKFGDGILGNEIEYAINPYEFNHYETEKEAGMQVGGKRQIAASLSGTGDVIKHYWPIFNKGDRLLIIVELVNVE
jgi:hypothetical protein